MADASRKERRNLSMDRAGTSPGFKKIFSNVLDSSADDGDGSEKETSKADDVDDASFVVTPASRRSRTEKETAEVSDKKPAKKGRGRKRALSGADDDVEDVATPAAKRWEKDEAAASSSAALKTPTKVVAQSAATSATKSPVGVNRRNAVLFTRKKQAAAVSTPEPREDSEDDLENRETEVQSPGWSKVPLKLNRDSKLHEMFPAVPVIEKLLKKNEGYPN